MNKMARKAMLAVLVLVAPMGITGCGILEALLAAEPGGTGAGPVAAHPQGSGNGAAKAGAIISAVGGILQGIGGRSQPDPSGFFPGDEVVPGFTALPAIPAEPRGQGFVPSSIPSVPGPSARAPQDSPSASDLNGKVVIGDPFKGASDIESRGLGSMNA